MKLTFLGSGTSHGVPVIGCSCKTCSSGDPRDKRTNASLHVSTGDRSILVDCGRDFRQQALRERLERVDYVLLTHTHFDHVAGIDDLRVFTAGSKEAIPVMGLAEHLQYLRTYIYHYLFDSDVQEGGGIALLDLVAVRHRFTLAGVLFEVLPACHGELPVLGYKFAGCAYLSDVSRIPTATMQKLYDLEVLVIDALRHDPHPTHFNLEQALEVVAEVKPKRALFTHICHDVLHREVEDQLTEPGSRYYTPYNVHLAYDGLSLEL